MKVNLRPEAARQLIMARAEDGISAGAQVLLEAAKQRCPVKTGQLRESGSARARGNAAAVIFSAPYAACVHEKGSKFLEAAANDSGVQEEMLSGIVRSLVV